MNEQPPEHPAQSGPEFPQAGPDPAQPATGEVPQSQPGQPPQPGPGQVPPTASGHVPPQFVPPHGQQHQQPGQYGYYPYQVQPPLPTNGYAVGSIITSSLSLATLLFTVGFGAPLTLIASIVGTVLGHKGKDDVDKGRAVQQRDLAVAGFWVGVAGIVLSILTIVAWVAFILFLIAIDESDSAFEFNHGMDWE